MQGTEIILRPYEVKDSQNRPRQLWSLTKDVVLLNRECSYLGQLPVSGKHVVLVQGNNAQVVGLDETNGYPEKIKFIRNYRHDRSPLEDFKIIKVDSGKSVAISDGDNTYKIDSGHMFTRPSSNSKRLEVRVAYYGRLPVLCTIDPRFLNADRVFLAKAVKMTEKASVSSVVESGKPTQSKVSVQSTQMELVPGRVYIGEFSRHEVKVMGTAQGGGYTQSLGKEFFVLGQDVYRLNSPVHESFMALK